jgi:hypothetical protein
MRFALPVIGIMGLLLSGCSGPATSGGAGHQDAFMVSPAVDPPAMSSPGDPNPAPPPAAAQGDGKPVPVVTRTIYSLTQTISGQSPPSPNSDGGLGGVKPALAQIYVMPPGAVAVSFSTWMPPHGGNGDGRIEIYDSNGHIVYKSEEFTRESAPFMGGGNEFGQDAAWGGLQHGVYTVRYFIAGELTPTVTVTADFPAAAATA